ncbi:thioesterase [Rhodococcus sp. G-MC3]|uniref:acyl-[acyl-carrier-protein] thioesterase n=1 Tax=Rhodococcus sp. G-MC3 TaxID=3046209 RepID=UPI0024BB4CA7|nr:acyl-ACP thioesterase domain-containing protein [Rhodococcus sp. G-MC3]MDJ0395849.1 thioesterase [Rhodococcus sp. G-MC3]
MPATTPDHGVRSQLPTSTALPEIPADATPFAASYRIRTHDVDHHMRVRLDAIARYLQDIATDMIEASLFYDSDPFWILRRTIIDVISPISWPGNVAVQRWCSATSTRWVNMRQRVRSTHESSPFNPQRRPPGLVETESFCIKVDPAGYLARISDPAQAELSRYVHDTRLKWRPLNTATPPDSATDRLFSVRSSDIDPFGHVNNATYWQAIEDQLEDNTDLLTEPHRAIVEFLRPIPPGAHPRIRARRTPRQLCLWILLEDGTVAATATVQPLPPLTSEQGVTDP